MHRGAAVLTLVVALVLSGVASAAKPVKQNNDSTIALVPLTDGLRTTSMNPTFGSQVTFDVSTSATDRPWVRNRCFRSGALVYEQWHGMYDDYYTAAVFTLGPTQSWTDGGATCTATLVAFKNGVVRELASTSYDVG